MRTIQGWGTRGLSDDPHEGLSIFQESLPVHLIATGRSAFKTCMIDEVVREVVVRNRQDGFDFVPVLASRSGGGETVVGVLDVAASGEAGDTAVRDQMQPLGEELLIGSDASILAFVRDADRHPFRFVVSGREISGLVTLSDLQQLPVRAALFATVTQLEMVMAEVIRGRYPSDTWMSLLPPSRADKVRDKLASAKVDDTLVDPLLYTEFCDKVTIVAKEGPCRESGPASKKAFRTQMFAIQSLRNHLAHANEYAASRDAATRVCECVRWMSDWIGSLAELASTPRRRLETPEDNDA